MDRYDTSADRIDARLDRREFAAERVDASVARITAGLSPYNDPLWSTGIRFAEHQYLLDMKAHLPTSGIDPAIVSALGLVTPTVSTVSPQLGNWAQDLLGISPQVESVFSRMESFAETVGASISAVSDATGRFFESARNSEIVVGVRDMISVLPNLSDFDGFFNAIAPAIEDFRFLMEDAREGEVVLEAAQFGFAHHLWNVFYLRTFADVDPKVRDAVVTNKLASLTREDDFAEALQGAVEGSRLLRKRWRIIRPALEAHQARIYELSVPPLLMQIEGTLVDAMFMKNLVVKKNNKFYLADKSGNLLIPPGGKKRLRPITLDPAIKNAKLEETPQLASASEFMADVLVQRRNAVLHGRDVTYGRAKLSVQALLLLLVLVTMVGEMEDVDS